MSRYRGRQILVDGLSVLIDTEDFFLVSEYTWRIRWDKQQKPRIVTLKNLYLSRLVMGCTAGDGVVIDHINHKTLDNRKCNLRKTTRAGNTRNRVSVKGSTSSFRGVSWDSENGKWRAVAELHGKHFFLGRYDDETIAAAAVEGFWSGVSI